eukprot:gene10266-10425_t
MHGEHEKILVKIEKLQAKIEQLQQQPPISAWQAASFLLFFLGFINFVGPLASFNLGMFMPWGVVATKSNTALMAKQLLGVAVPLTNTSVVLVLCAQAIKAAIACLKW